MIDNYRNVITLFIEFREKSDEELMNVVRSFADRKETDVLKAEFAMRELRGRGYKPTVAFEKEGDE